MGPFLIWSEQALERGPLLSSGNCPEVVVRVQQIAPGFKVGKRSGEGTHPESVFPDRPRASGGTQRSNSEMIADRSAWRPWRGFARVEGRGFDFARPRSLVVRPEDVAVRGSSGGQ